MNLEDLRSLLTAALDRAEHAIAELERPAREPVVPTCPPAETVALGKADDGDGVPGYPCRSWLV